VPGQLLADLEQSIVAPMLPTNADDDVALLVARLIQE
jgi:hypothetical protein